MGLAQLDPVTHNWTVLVHALSEFFVALYLITDEIPQIVIHRFIVLFLTTVTQLQHTHTI